MKPGSRYNMTITVTLTEEGKKEAPMSVTTQQYNGLTYGHACAVEGALIGAFAELNKIGADEWAVAQSKVVPTLR